MESAIWITWEHQVRNRSMARVLHAALHVFACRGGRLKRYFLCGMRTVALVVRTRPPIVFCQNPSIALVLLLLLLRVFLRYRLVSDAHYAGVVACNANRHLQRLLDACNRWVDLVIVTTPEHAARIRELGGKAVVSPDPLPDLSGYPQTLPVRDKSVLFICSFDVDEPYRAVFEAAQALAREGFRLCVTGNYSKVVIDPAQYPAVHFLGYLPEEEYYRALLSCCVVIDLTENENCLVCGAYEAMSAEKPLVTSDTASLRRFFHKGTVFSCHDPGAICGAVQAAYHRRQELRDEIVAWKRQAEAAQCDAVGEIYRSLGLCCAASAAQRLRAADETWQ